MSRKPLIFSVICVLGLTGLSLAMWLNLPEQAQYPIHWNTAGEADGFAGRNAVLGVLMIIPATLIFTTAMLYFIPKIEPLRQNFEQSRSAYNIVWSVIVCFLTIVGIAIAMMYQPNAKFSIADPLRWMAGWQSLLFMIIGNVMGKVRQNFMFGIRTPWTLSSDLSWEKTHRIGGRLFVLAGVIGLLLTLFVPMIAFPVVITSLLSVVAFTFVYSYRVWKGDPDKRR